MPCRYMDGERLSAEDEKEVVEKLLVYHPHSEDKIGCGLDSIMVKCNLFMQFSYIIFYAILAPQPCDSGRLLIDGLVGLP